MHRIVAVRVERSLDGGTDWFGRPMGNGRWQSIEEPIGPELLPCWMLETNELDTGTELFEQLPVFLALAPFA